MSSTDYVVGYGDNSRSRWGPSPKQHAVVNGTQTKRTVGFAATSVCGRSVRLGSNAQQFDPTNNNACATCARTANPNPQEPSA